MPHTFNADRQDKIAKQKYQVTNWQHIMKACVNVVI